MILSHATLDGLRVSFSKEWQAAYEGTPTFWQQLAVEVPSSTKSNVYGWLATQLKMRKWDGPRIVRNLKEHAHTITNAKFEVTFGVQRDEIEDDNLGLYASIQAPQLGEAARKHPDSVLVERLQSGTTATLAFDGLPLFDNAHPSFDQDGTTYDNNFGLALTKDNYITVRSEMRQRVGEDGKPIVVRPNLLIVPPQLEDMGLQILKNQYVAAAVRNVGGTENVAAAAIENTARGTAELLVIDELANEGTEWYLADTTKRVKPFVMQNRRPPEFVSRTNLADPHVFDLEEFLFGCSARFEIAPTLPFLIARSKP